MSSSSKNTPVCRFKVGDRVRIKDQSWLFYSRVQLYARGVEGTIARLNYTDLVAEDETFNVEGEIEQHYIVQFRQQDLWPEYAFPNDTLQSEYPDRWLEPLNDSQA